MKRYVLAAIFAVFPILAVAQTTVDDCAIHHAYQSGVDGNYYALCWSESAAGVLTHSVVGYSPPAQCDADGSGGDGDGDPAGCAEPGPPVIPVLCDADPSTDAPPCRLPAGCNDGSDGRDGAQCYCTTNGAEDSLPDCPFD